MSVDGEACVEIDPMSTAIQYCRDDEPYCVVSQLLQSHTALSKQCVAGKCDDALLFPIIVFLSIYYVQ